MSGGKGGSQTSQTTIPAWVQGPASRNLDRAEQLAKIGYQPYYGPEIPPFNPMQVAGMQSAPDAASAFGLAPRMNVASMMPKATDYGGGMMGYGSGEGFEQAVKQFQTNQPQQAALYNSQFVGPSKTSGFFNNPRIYNGGNLNLGFPGGQGLFMDVGR